MEQSTSVKPKHKRESPWDLLLLIPIWLAFSYFSVAFPHKTFHFFLLEVPMTPLLLFFVSSVILFADFLRTTKKFGLAIFGSLVINLLIFLPVPVAWGLLSFYEVSTFLSFLAVLIVPIIILYFELETWLKSGTSSAASDSSMRNMRGIPKPLRLIGLYASGLFFGYGTMISVSCLFCFITNQSFEVFARANPAIILVGGATIMAGILALARPSS